MASAGASTEEQGKVDYDVFYAQFDDQYAKDFTNGHKIWVENELIPEIRPVFEKCDRYRILSVGSGSGYADAAILERLASFTQKAGLSKRKIQYTVVEPDPKAVALCQKNLQPFTKAFDIDFVYKVVPSEKYLMELQEEFELIHFVHAISWVKKPPEILKNCYEKLLIPGGTLAIVDFEATYAEEGEFEGEHLPYVRVDKIAEEHKWNCRLFPNTIKQDYTEVYKKTAIGRKRVANFFGQDVQSFTDEEYEKAASHFCEGIEKELVEGEERYFSPLKETVYFLTKSR